MGQFSNDIRAKLTAQLISGRKNTAANLRVIYGSVADAVEFLEGLQRGSKLLPPGTTAPSSADGLDGDAYINSVTSDYWYKASGAWSLVFRLKGADGVTPQKGIDYFDGFTPRKGVDYSDGQNGKSAYQLWVGAGNSGTVTQFLASLQGGDGLAGARGSKTRWESFAPTTDSGNAGDTWYYSISAAKYALYECLGPQSSATVPSEATGTVVVNPASWRLRFTSPDASTSTGSGFTPVVSGDGTKYLSDNGSYTKPPTSSGTATFPPQSAATVGQYLQSLGTAGTEAWAGMKVGYVLRFLNAEVQEPQRFFRATTVYRIEKDAGVASVSYAVNGAAAVAVAFTADVWTGTLQLPAKASVMWVITYNASTNEGNVEIIGTELTTP